MRKRYEILSKSLPSYIVGRAGVPYKGGAPSTKIIKRKQELTLVEEEEVELETNMLQWNGCWEGWCWMSMEI